ncbi:hypothetical protein B0H13DRAFT_1654762 [Mycena leptocephala]|nr:hypothetical protein B0H13DRAFT_1654762 [Mycena leptocephala]
MKISIRSIQKDIYQIDAEPTDFIGAIKSKIEQSQGFTPSSQKIIFSGKVLADDKTLESYGFRGETDYLVLIVAKVHVPASRNILALSTAAASMPTAEETLAAATLASSDASSAPTPVSSTPGAPIHAFGDTSFFPIGEALQSTISNMVNMGFEPDQVQRALRASYNNPDRAVEYLTTEIPAHLDAEGAAAVQVSPASAPVTPASDQAQNLLQPFEQQQQQTGAGAGLGALRAGSSRDPRFQQFRQHLMQNPEPFLRFLAVQNPQMAQAFTANPELLVQLLAAVEGGESPLLSAQGINVPGEDRVAIEQLEALGFPRLAAIEAYLVCDKDEELAANYLLENGF